jgi:hypothetical protein
VTGARSFTRSYGSLIPLAAPSACELVSRMIVWPSGFALTVGFDPDHAARAAAVVDDHLLAPALRELRRERAGVVSVPAPGG